MQYDISCDVYIYKIYVCQMQTFECTLNSLYAHCTNVNSILLQCSVHPNERSRKRGNVCA